ncbi:MAG: hypothetical protein SNJ83_10685 [Aggregatilineales bacterium]
MVYNFDGHIAPLFLELRRVVGEGLMQAGLAIGLDHANRTPKPWTYYLGVAAGATAIASGIPNASLILYCAASALDLLIFQSPEGGLVDVFIDGVAATNFTTFAANQIWEAYQVSVNGSAENVRRVEFVTRATDANGDPVSVNWFSVAGITPVDGSIVTRPAWTESPPWQVTITLRDQRGRRGTMSFHVPYFVTGTDLERFVKYFVDVGLKRVAVGRVIAVNITRRLLADDRLSPEDDGTVFGRARLTFTDNNDQELVLSVPCWRESLTKVDDKSRIPDRLDVNVSGFIDLVTNPNQPRNGAHNLRICDARGVMLHYYRKGRFSVVKR